MEGKTELHIYTDDGGKLKTGLCSFDDLVEFLMMIRDLSFIKIGRRYINKMHIIGIEAGDKELFDAAYEYVIKGKNGNLFH